MPSPCLSTLSPFLFSLFDFSVNFFSKGNFKVKSTVKPFANTVILVRGVVLIFYSTSMLAQHST